MRRPARTAGLAAALLTAALALSGCQAILDSLLDTAAPGGLDASDGDYADCILVSWSAPDLSSERWAGYSVSRYDISWSGPASGSGSTGATSFSIPVAPADRAKAYSVSVAVELSGGPESGGSASDSGFAMDAAPLAWRDGGAAYTLGGERWYETMLQEGFSYRFEFAGGDGSVAFCPFESLEEVAATTAGPAGSWTCDDEGKEGRFYVKVKPAGATGFTARCDYGYGF